jgi:amidase
VVTASVGRESSPEVRELTLKIAALLEGLGHQVEEVTPPIPGSFRDDFILYWSMLAMGLVAGGRRTHGSSWDAGRLDHLTLGLARHCRRNLHKLPLATLRLARSKKYTARFFETYDVTLTPTLATETPRVGRLDPGNAFEEVMDRLEEWVAFTPLQNATGDPAISLPLARTAGGLPLGMMFGGPTGGEAGLLALAYELEETQPFQRIQDAEWV